MSTQEKVAAGVSAAILLAAAIYWIAQIIDVVATVKLAGSLKGCRSGFSPTPYSYPENPIQRPDEATTNQIAIDASAISLSVMGFSCV